MAQDRGDAQITFSFMELSYTEFTKNPPPLRDPGISAATSQAKNSSISRNSAFHSVHLQHLEKISFLWKLCLICSRESPCPPPAEPCSGSRCLWKEFFLWLWDISFQGQEPSTRVPGSGEFQPQPRLFFSAHWCHLEPWIFHSWSKAQQCQQNTRPNFTQSTLLTPPGKTADGGKKNPKCQHFRGINPLHFLIV